MRLVHLSDIHLSKDNFKDFQRKYRGALLKDLEVYHSQKKIDVIVITGDLVDKGGDSLLTISEFESCTSPYEVFEREFIDPILKKGFISKENILFVPGNHDIDESEILWVDEKKMKSIDNPKTIEEYIDENHKAFDFPNKRIERFKEFEKKFHKDNDRYIYTNNQSTYIYNYNQQNNIGFLLVNDSWRCSTCRLFDKDDGKHFFGVDQLYNGLMELEKYGTNLNICLFHHGISNFKEETEVKSFLKNKEIDLFLYGHYHNIEFDYEYQPVGSAKGIRGRASFNNINEKDSHYMPGYQIIDFDFEKAKIDGIHFRVYNLNSMSFVSDTIIAPNEGIDRGENDSGFFYLSKFKKTEKVLDRNRFKM